MTDEKTPCDPRSNPYYTGTKIEGLGLDELRMLWSRKYDDGVGPEDRVRLTIWVEELANALIAALEDEVTAWKRNSYDWEKRAKTVVIYPREARRQGLL